MAKKTTTENQTVDLQKTLNDKRREMRDLAFKGAGSRMPNVRLVRQLRRDIARALTVANQTAKK